ncbi:hypothetical protein [Ruegeria arenilitoris]|uniref:hypothetical protein n=1 Tax=Ruegeria arenilitoris TaxID=1173585 RepID=UPI00147DF825|nr:hypothetical protein [Ruegeria arenilitoris]
MKKLIFPALVGSLLTSACAQKAEKVTAAYVPTTLYSGESCKDLRLEQARVVAQVNHLAGEQDKKAQNDAVAMGVGLVVFWPALFLMAADKDESSQLAQMKGQYDAIQAAGAQKGCWT